MSVIFLPSPTLPVSKPSTVVARIPASRCVGLSHVQVLCLIRIQWCDISKTDAAATQTSAAHLSSRTHRFFDSRGPDGTRAPRPDPSSDGGHSITQGGQVLTFKRDHHRLFSHHGYVNTVRLVRGLIESAPTEEVLLSGAGDGVVKLWRLGQDANTTPTQMAKLQNGDPVLSIAVDGSFLYCGLAGGALNIWNLDSHQLVKRITRHTGDLWAVDIIRGIAVCGDSNGIVKVCYFPPFDQYNLLTLHRNLIQDLRKSVAGWHMREPCWHQQLATSRTDGFMPPEATITPLVSGT